jgi:hypothetical protein
VYKFGGEIYTPGMPPPTQILLPTLSMPFEGVYTPDPTTGKITIMSFDISNFRKISVMVATNAATGVALTVNVSMFLPFPAVVVGQFPNGDGLIHTYDVVAVNFSLYLMGALLPGGGVLEPIPLIGGVFCN